MHKSNLQSNQTSSSLTRCFSWVFRHSLLLSGNDLLGLLGLGVGWRLVVLEAISVAFVSLPGDLLLPFLESVGVPELLEDALVGGGDHLAGVVFVVLGVRAVGLLMIVQFVARRYEFRVPTGEWVVGGEDDMIKKVKNVNLRCQPSFIVRCVDTYLIFTSFSFILHSASAIEVRPSPSG